MSSSAELTKKEKDFSKKLIVDVYDTAFGPMTIKDMIDKFGDPILELKYSRIECRHPKTGAPALAEKLTGANLAFESNLVVKNVGKEFALSIKNKAVVRKLVRYQGYDPENPPIARDHELIK